MHRDVAEYLAGRGCPDVARINREYCVRDAARGDVDFAAVRGDVLLVAEVKTRLLAKYFGRSYLRDMLVYHLSEPSVAREAWDRLEKLGVVRRPPCSGVASRDYDSPASIAELVRSVVGLCLKNPDACNRARVLVAAAITACYAKPLVNAIVDSVDSASGYLRECLGVDVKPAVILIHPDPLVFNGGGLHRIEAECIGEGCPVVGGLKGVDEPLRGCDEHCKPCSGCRYLRLCSRVCRRAA